MSEENVEIDQQNRDLEAGSAGSDRRYWLTPGLNGEFPISVTDDSGRQVFEILRPRERSETGSFQIHDAAGSEIAQVRWPQPSWFSSAKSRELLLGDVPAGIIERKRRRFS